MTGKAPALPSGQFQRRPGSWSGTVAGEQFSDRMPVGEHAHEIRVPPRFDANGRIGTEQSVITAVGLQVNLMIAPITDEPMPEFLRNGDTTPLA
jgi:hypothetical protein